MGFVFEGFVLTNVIASLAKQHYDMNSKQTDYSWILLFFIGNREIEDLLAKSRFGVANTLYLPQQIKICFAMTEEKMYHSCIIIAFETSIQRYLTD